MFKFRNLLYDPHSSFDCWNTGIVSAKAVSSRLKNERNRYNILTALSVFWKYLKYQRGWKRDLDHVISFFNEKKNIGEKVFIDMAIYL